jgi:energy-converting hydrogenase Eha subunit G
LYFAACVPTRLALAVAVIVMGVYLPRVTGVAAIVAGTGVAIYNAILQERRACRWWHPNSSTVVAVAAILAGALVLAHRAPAVLVGALLMAHVVAGVALALQIRPWRS